MILHGVGAVVTGGAGGLGSAVVRQLVTAGATVGIVDVNEDSARPLLEGLGPAVSFYPAQVSNERSVKTALESIHRLAPLRVVVCCHGGPPSGGRTLGRDAEPLDLAVFEQTVAAYLTGTFNVLRLAAAIMSTNEPSSDGERGVVVCTSSIASFEGQVGQVSYAAAKGGVNAMTLVAPRDLASVGIRVVPIAPGLFLTPAYRLSEEDAKAKWGGLVPFPKRMGHPVEYAGLVQHICENGYLNGEVIRLDGAVRFPPSNPPVSSSTTKSP